MGAMMLLGEKPPGDDMIWKKCGARHKARFMAYCIYSNKALAFSEQLEYDEEVVADLIKFCSFTCTLFIPQFLSSSIGADAAINDLTFYKHLFNYKEIDPTLAEVGLAVMRRHGWFLVEQVQPFSLFSSKLDNDMKSRLASRILTFENKKPTSYPLAMPTFPNITPNTELFDLVGPSSFMFFHILGLDYTWLQSSPENWEEYESYRLTFKPTN